VVIVKKIEAAKYFTENLVKELGNRIHVVILFGSTIKGYANTYSDIDLLIVVDKIDDKIYNAISKIAYNTYQLFNESIETLTYSIEEFLQKYFDDTNIFMMEIKNHGKILYINNAILLERAKKLIQLSREYYEYAKHAHNYGFYRIVIDLCQNALELLLKALIIVKGRELPKTHSGYIYVFSELYVKSGKVSQDWIGKLYKALELRNKARYEPDIQFSISDSEWILKLYEEFLKEVESLLKT